MSKCIRAYCNGDLLIDPEDPVQLKCTLCSRSVPVENKIPLNLELQTREFPQQVGAIEAASYLGVSRETIWRMVQRQELHYGFEISGLVYDLKELRFIGNLRQCGYRLRYGPGTLIPPKVIAAISTMNGQTITTQAINYKLRTQALAGTCCGHLRYGFVEMVKNHWPDGFQRFMGSVSNASTGKM